MTARTITSSSDGDVDRFIKESCKSYKECNVKNHARRNSLQRRTLGIESERRLASASLSREEKMLREQLKQMNIEKAKHHIMHNLRESNPKKKKQPKKSREEEPHVIPTEPYPVTFRTQTPSPTDLDKHIDKAGHRYAARGRRRQSKEFEDLRINTGPGSLFHIHEEDEDSSPRPRVYSMSYASKILAKKHLNTSHHSGSSHSPRTSPNLRRHVLSKRNKGGHSSGSSIESLSESNERIGSLTDLHWLGEPEAIHSVRRPRKTIEEQELESEFHKLAI